MAALFLAPFYILVNLYVSHWMLLWLEACNPFFQTLVFRIIFTGVYIFFSTSLLSGFLIKKPASLRRCLKIIGNYFLGISLYILTVILVADLCRIILLKSLQLSWIKNKGIFVLSGFLCFLLILGLSIYGILHAYKIKTTVYHITINKTVPKMDHLRIALFADCHFGYNTGLFHARKIVRKVNRAKPDLICIAGDIFDNEYEAVPHPEKLCRILRSLKSKYGTYACWGNHDLNEPILAGFTFPSASSDIVDSRMEDFVKSCGIQLLEDETLLINNSFYLTGRRDPDRARKTNTKRKTPVQLTKDLDRSKPVIILDHQPKELQELQEAGADLDLCGHTHDGQMFPGNIITRLFWKNSCGYLQKGSMHNIVTSGTGLWGPAMRIGTSSEICIIEISFRS